MDQIQISTSTKAIELEKLDQGDTEIETNPSNVIENLEQGQLQSKVPEGGLWAWLMVAGGFCLSFSTFGYVVSWGTYQGFYESELLADKTPSQIAWIGSLQYSLIFLPGIFAGRLFDLGYFKATLIVCSAFMTVANFLIAECTKYWHFVLCQGILLGLSAGCVYIPCIAVVSHWFNRRRPLAFALVAFGASVGGIVYPIMIRNLLPRVGFKWTVRTIAFLNTATFVIAIITMRTRLPPPSTLPKLFDMKSLTSPAYLFYVFSTLVSLLGLFTPLTFVSVSATLIGIDSNFAFYLVAIANAASAVGRVTSGILAVAYGPVNVLAVFTVFATIFTYIWPFVTTKGAFIGITILYGITSGAFNCLFAVPAAQFGDPGDVGRRTGTQMTIMAFGALAGPPISGAIKQDHPTFHEVGIYAGTMVAASVFLMMASKYCAQGRLWGGRF